MRGTVAKRIRKEVYGDMSSASSVRKYRRDIKNGTIYAEPLRQHYRQVKKEYIKDQQR